MMLFVYTREINKQWSISGEILIPNSIKGGGGLNTLCICFAYLMHKSKDTSILRKKIEFIKVFKDSI